MTNNFLRQLKLGSMHLLRCRNVSAFAAARIVSPLLRQIQSRIYQTGSIPSPQRAKHSNLTVVLFAQASIPLARHPYRVLAFLLKAAFINVQPRADRRCACRFEDETAASFLLDRLIARDAELGRHIDGAPGRLPFIRYLIEQRWLDLIGVTPDGQTALEKVTHPDEARITGTANVNRIKHAGLLEGILP
jgi:hypothetical protein